MIVLGLDPSLTNFGWALLDTDDNSCLERGRFQTSAKTLFVERYCDLRSSLAELLKRTEVVYVGCEYPVFKSLYSEGMYGLWLYTAEALHEYGANLVVFSPPQIKEHARLILNRPRNPDGSLWVMDKMDMVDAAKKASGDPSPWNHNEADAYWVGHTAGRFWRYLEGSLQDGDLTKSELRQFAKVYKPTRGKNRGRVFKKGIKYREGERYFRWRDKQSGQEK